MKKIITFSFLLITIMLFAIGCTDVSNVKDCLSPNEHTYGFGGGGVGGS